MQRLFQGNLASNPEDFGLISWNEITEGTYIAPMTRYGQQDLSVVAALTKTNYSFPTYTYVASSRWRTAVYINGLVKSYSAQPAVGPTGAGHHHLPAAQPARQLADDARPHLRQRRRDDRRVHPAEASIEYRLVALPTRTTHEPAGAPSTVR